MSRPKTPRPPLQICEIIYGVRMCRDRELDLKWLDKPACDYVVQHHCGGTVTLIPSTDTRYVVTAGHDDLVVLRQPFKVKEGMVQVRHAADGTITITPQQSLKDEHPSGLRQRGLHWATSDSERTVIRYDDGFHSTMNDRFIPEAWNRTKEGLDARSRELRDAELRSNVGDDRWQKIIARRKKTRAVQANRKSIVREAAL